MNCAHSGYPDARMTYLVRSGTILITVRSLLGLLALLTMLVLAPATGWAQTSPRAAEHDGFGRMVFDWDGPVRWSADVVGTDLVLRFEKPVGGDPRILVRPLARYLASATISPDRRMVSFALKIPVQVKSFVTGTSTVVDLSPGGPAAEAASPPTPAPAAPAPSKPEPSKPAPPKPAPPSNVNVRGGEHTGFNRIVFDWPAPVNYAVNEIDGRAVISFEKPARVNTTSLEASLPSDVRLVEVRPHGAGTAVVLALPRDMRVRHFTSGPKVAVDLVRPAGAAPPPRAAGTPLPPLAPAPGAAEQPTAPAASGGEAGAETPTLPKEDLAKILPKGEAESKPASPAQPRRVASLGVPFDQPTAAAAFRRAGWLWLVFDRRVEVDVGLLRRSGGDLVRHVEQVDDVRGGTAIRMITVPGFNPSVRKEGLLWVFDLLEQPMAPKIPLEVGRQFDFDDRGRLLVKVSEAASSPITLRDPEIGDLIQVVPVMPVAAGIRSPLSLPAVDLLATAQGVVAVPKADSVRLETSRTGIDISMPGGLFMSRETAAGDKAGADPVRTSSGPLDIARWMRGGLDKFTDEHQKLMERFTRVKPEGRNTQRLEVARHYLANAMAAEALGVLKVMAMTDPTIAEQPEFLAVRGAANFLMERDFEAIADLSAPVLGTDPQVGLWLAAAKSRFEGQPARHALMLRLAPEEIKGLSPRLRVSLGRVAVVSVAAAGDAKAASRIIEAINGPGLSRRDGGTLAYLQGLAAEAGRSFEQAEAKYREAEAGESRPDRAFAGRRRIEMQLAQGDITPAEAIPQLERLRFAWRAGDYEYDLLKRLGELMLSGGMYGDGLRMLRSVVDNYPEHPDIGNVQQLMNDAFARLFLEGGADKLSPIVAIGLFDEFQELTPPGQRGDEMIRKLADRLASVDLLERAADLLRHQVRFRLQAEERARIGARLAFLELSNRKPALALEALNLSEMEGLPEDLHNQRRYMRVRALTDLGRSAQALDLLLNDFSPTAAGLRAEIYWGMKKWPEAATAIEATLDPGQPLNTLGPVQTRRILDLATALTLARDDRALLKLRRTYGEHMAGTEYREAFELLTSEPERGIPDYRRVGEKIKQAEDFQTFMGEWRKRVEAEGLSAIN